MDFEVLWNSIIWLVAGFDLRQFLHGVRRGFYSARVRHWRPARACRGLRLETRTSLSLIRVTTPLNPPPKLGLKHPNADAGPLDNAERTSAHTPNTPDWPKQQIVCGPDDGLD